MCSLLIITMVIITIVGTPDLCLSSGETPWGAPAMSIIIIIAIIIISSVTTIINIIITIIVTVS